MENNEPYIETDLRPHNSIERFYWFVGGMKTLYDGSILDRDTILTFMIKEAIRLDLSWKEVHPAFVQMNEEMQSWNGPQEYLDNSVGA